MKTMQKYGMMATGGVLALVAFKLIMAFVVPVLIVFFGVAMTALKIALIAAVGYFIYSLFRRRTDPTAEV
ncbi:MAG: hypothetical protein RQ745_08305 [Longimicrobiales bacterium]|nr:hypothetical protein [Longimicrobiales bacterium]